MCSRSNELLNFHNEKMGSSENHPLSTGLESTELINLTDKSSNILYVQPTSILLMLSKSLLYANVRNPKILNSQECLLDRYILSTKVY